MRKAAILMTTAATVAATLLAPVTVNAETTTYQAENATIVNGVVEANHTGFTGTGFVNYDNVTGSAVEWTINVGTAGSATLTFRFANGTTTSRPTAVTVDGAALATPAFAGTGSWDTWATATVSTTLTAGTHTVRATATTANGGPNVDSLSVDVNASSTLQAENATIFHGVVEANHAGFTGTGFVNYNNEVGSFVEWTISAATAGSTNLSIRYANGTTTSRPMTVAVDGTTLATPAFAGTGSWDSWASASVPATLSAGTHTVRATATTANGGPNVDSLTLGDSGGGGGAPTASELLAKINTCTQISNGKYKTDSENSRTIPVCDKNGAVYWQADMDIDCDGVRTTQCNENTDCCFQPDTAFHTSTGQPLNAAQLPYVVVPSPSSTWDYRQFGLRGGGIVAVIFNNQVEYAVIGDTGPTDIIGEASYRTAADLGINPDPSNGGTDSGVTYIFFKNSQASPIENHNNAVTQGQQLARQFINNN